jgi:hypothetical protein
VTIASLIVNVEANTVQLQKDVAKVQSSLDSVSSLASKVGTAIAGAFTVQAVIAFAHELGEFAGRMNDLSAETGIGVERLQALNYVAAGVGLTVEDITGAIEKMARKVAGGDQSAARALDILGLSFAQLQAMSPDEAFIAIGQAVAKIEDPMQRIRIETELFGKSGARMGRAFTEDMQKVIEAAEKSGAVINKRLIGLADSFDDAWHQATIRGKAYVASFVGWVLDHTTLANSALAQAARSLEDVMSKVKAPHLTGADPFSAGPSEAEILGINAQSEALQKSLPAMIASAKAAAELREQYDKLMGSVRNEEGLALMADDAETLADSLFRLVPEVDTLSDALEDLENNAGKVKLTGLWSMPNAGPNQHVSDQPGFLGRMAGGFGNSMKQMWDGMSGGKGVAGLFSNIGRDIVSGGLNSLMNAGVSLLTKGISSLVGKLFGGEGKKTNDERDSWIEKNFGSSDQLRKLAVEAGVADSTLRELFSTKKVSDFERIAQQVADQIHGFSDDQAADQERLQAAIEKYGFSLEQLPQKMQQSKLDDIAKNLIEDWRVLLDNGFDLDTVNQKMTDSVNEYLQMALRTASEVPAAMRPMLQKFLEQGLLTDENGNKITDLEVAGVHFAESMTQGFDRVVQKLQELIEKLHLAGDAITNLPSVPNAPSAWTAPDEVPQIDPTEGFATGTGGRYLNFGSGRNVRLHGWERVSTANEGQREGGGLLAEMRGIRAEMRDFPRAIKIAIQDAKVLAR